MQKIVIESRVIVAALAAALLLTGCMSWTPGWKSEPIASPAVAQPADSTPANADALLENAGDATSLQRAIAAFEARLVASPNDRAILSRLAETHILYGAAYAKSTGEKGEWYRTGIRYAERAMATNATFSARIAAGHSLGEAVATLSGDDDDMRAMLFWVTGVSYYFKECLGLRTLVYFRWMLGTREVMERMLTLNPEFEHGAVLFSLGIYNLALPPGAGRDMKKSEEFLARAVAASGPSLLPRWGRAKYFQTKTSNREGFREDLEWVVAQDPRAGGSPYAWNVYFQRDAREMLARIDDHF